MGILAQQPGNGFVNAANEPTDVVWALRPEFDNLRYYSELSLPNGFR